MTNVIVVYHIETGEPRMVVVDAADPNDSAWNPPGHAHIYIPHKDYHAMKHEDLMAHVTQKIKGDS